MLEIQTERLRLIALTQEQLVLALEHPGQLSQSLGFPLATSVITPVVQRALSLKLVKMAGVEDDQYPWYTYWLVTITTGPQPVGVGLMGFKGAPGAQGKFDGVGEVEIGYGIAPEFGRRGYTTEAARALIDWALAHAECRSVIAAEVLKTNSASIRVLEKVGMTLYAETDDALFYRIDRPR